MSATTASTRTVRGLRTVIVDNGISTSEFTYASLTEAKAQADRWVAEAIRFVTEKADYVIVHGAHSWRVGRCADRSVLVFEKVYSQRRSRLWTMAEVRDAYRARWSR